MSGFSSTVRWMCRMRCRKKFVDLQKMMKLKPILANWTGAYPCQELLQKLIPIFPSLPASPILNDNRCHLVRKLVQARPQLLMPGASELRAGYERCSRHHHHHHHHHDPSKIPSKSHLQSSEIADRRLHFEHRIGVHSKLLQHWDVPDSRMFRTAWGSPQMTKRNHWEWWHDQRLQRVIGWLPNLVPFFSAWENHGVLRYQLKVEHPNPWRHDGFQWSKSQFSKRKKLRIWKTGIRGSLKNPAAFWHSQNTKKNPMSPTCQLTYFGDGRIPYLWAQALRETPEKLRWSDQPCPTWPLANLGPIFCAKLCARVLAKDLGGFLLVPNQGKGDFFTLEWLLENVVKVEECM